MILVVDDDPIAAAITQAILEEAGHATMVAETAEEALSAARKDPDIELVVSDHHMPGTSGIELLGELRGAGVLVPFVLLSGDGAALGNAGDLIDAVLEKGEALQEELPAVAERLIAAKGGRS